MPEGLTGLARSLFLLALIGWFGWVGFHTYQAERYIAVSTLTRNTNQLASLAYVGKAYETFPWSVRFRRQLIASFNNAIAAYGKRLKISPPAAEAIFRVGFTVTPYDVLTHISRAQFHLNRRDLPAVRSSLAALLKVVPNMSQVWLIAAWEAALSGRDPRPFARTGLALSNSPFATKQLQQFARTK